jgi:predicted  nucleic acid-binding Zn-ribbon protein
MTVMNVAEEIKKLVELQQLDIEIFGIKRELEWIPEKIAEYDASVKAKEGLFKGSEEKSKKLAVKKKEKEMELGTKEEAIKKHQGQLFQVKTNQEYSALQKEIASIGADKSILEEDILKLFDDIDAAEKEVARDKDLFQKEKIKIESEKKQFEQKKSELETRLGTLNAQRAELAKNVNVEALAKYERILVAREGSALVPIENESACGGCNMNLPPQIINEVRMNTDFVVCGNCSRILYSKG